jgi:type I restriction enzyme S subunit
VSELPKGWSSVPFGDLGAEVTGSILPDPAMEYELYSVPTFATRKPEIVLGSQIGSHKRPVRSGDVLVCKINPRINRVWMVGEPAKGRPQLASTEYLVFRVNEPILARYLVWYLTGPQFRSWIELATEGATGSHTRAKSGPILQQYVPVPPMAEQGRIVAAIDEQLSRLDDAERLLESARRRTKRMRLAALDAVTPVDGAWTTLGEIANLTGGVTKDSKRQSDPSFIEVPYLRVANVQRGYLDLGQVTTIRVPPEKARALRLERGDILFNEGGDRDKLGRGWIWQGELNECIHQNHVFRARLITDEFDPKFVSLHGNTFGKAWFEQMGKQTTNLASLNLTTLKRFPIPVLPVDKQRQIVAKAERELTLVDSLGAAIDRGLMRSERLRRAILGRALSGQLVAHDAIDESATEERLAHVPHDWTTSSMKPQRKQRA